MTKLYLKPTYKKLQDEYNEMLHHRGCSCHISPPCALCTHEGHPLSLENNPNAWVIPRIPIDRDEISKAIRYDAESGKLYYIETGKECLSRSDEGYVFVYHKGKRYRGHRVAWVIHYGNIDDSVVIDHINGIVDDNRIENLRIATHIENSRNKRVKNKVGYRGVYKKSNSSRFYASIKLEHGLVYLGSYPTAEDAHEAYKSAAMTHYGEFYNMSCEVR